MQSQETQPINSLANWTSKAQDCAKVNPFSYLHLDGQKLREQILCGKLAVARTRIYYI